MGLLRPSAVVVGGVVVEAVVVGHAGHMDVADQELDVGGSPEHATRTVIARPTPASTTMWTTSLQRSGPNRQS